MTVDVKKACRVKVLDRRGRPRFELCFYGLHAAELNLANGDYGSNAIIYQALRRRGLNPSDFICTPFHIEDLPRVAGRGVPREYHRHT